MSGSDFCEVVITAADPEWLAEFTRRLVADRLAACGNPAYLDWVRAETQP